MTEAFEYALLAGAAYVANRNKNNWIPAPSGWTDLSASGGYRYDSSSGFEATAFRNGNEIVISFAGTDQPIDWYTNVGSGLGFFGLGQLKAAAAFYAKIRAQYGDNVTYTFTGHSLGGGIAALMGVFFNQKSVTFDPAPFRQTANNDTRTLLRNYLAYQSLLSPSLTDALGSFWSSQAANGEGASTQQGIRGEGNVSITSVEGEALLLLLPSYRIGFNPKIIHHAGTAASSIDLHSIALLAAMAKVPAFAAAAKALPNLIPMIFDTNLYAHDATNEKTNFMELLMRREVGFGGAVGDGMLTHFAADALRLAGAGGRAVSDADLNKALITFLLQAYHNQESGFTKELFQSVSGGLRFDRATVIGGEADMKGYIAFQAWLGAHSDIYSDAEMATFNGAATQDREWFIATNSRVMNATAGAKGALMLGGSGIDVLTGGSNNDLLIAGTNSDILAGGKGDDTLMGGNGTDIYLYKIGDGNDIVIDSDKQGRIFVSSADGKSSYDTTNLTQDKDNATLYKSPDGKVTLTTGGNWVLSIEGGGSIDLGSGCKGGDFGIHLQDAAGKVEPTNTLTGDQDDDKKDTLTGTAASDLIDGRTDDDRLSGGEGNDRVVGSKGQDWLYGDQGDDILEGGEDRDIMEGGDGKDRLYADVEIGLAQAIENGRTRNGTDKQGEWLSGGQGNDTLVGGDDKDVLVGGADDDILVGGAGDDDIFGDVEIAIVSQVDWSVQRELVPVTDTSTSHELTIQGATIINSRLSGGGNDVIYAGAGSDWVRGGAGDDWIAGEGGDDAIWGQGGDDIGFGGEGDDYLDGGWGGFLLDSSGQVVLDGNDYLEGGAGNDFVGGALGNDTLIGGAGNDELHGDSVAASDALLGLDKHGADYLDGGEGDDTLFGYGGNDTLMGGAGNDKLSGDYRESKLPLANHGADVLDGGAGDDELYGQGGNDILNGGTDTDYLDGGAGNDRYELAAGEGQLSSDGAAECITDASGTDTVALGGAINSVTKNPNSNDLVIYYGNNDCVVVTDGASGNIEQFEVGGETLSYEQLIGQYSLDVIAGIDTAGLDHLAGGKYDDSLDSWTGGTTYSGGQGNDVMTGQGGNNTYWFNQGDGGDAIIDVPGNNIVRFGQGLSAADIVVSQGQAVDGNRYLVLDFGQGDQLSVRDGEIGAITEYRFADGSVLSTADLVARLGSIDSLGGTGSDVMTGTAGDDRLSGLAGDDTLSGNAGNDILLGGAGDDVLLGGHGDDQLLGGRGNDRLDGGDGVDTYWMTLGMGNDTVLEASGQQSQLNLANGLSFASLSPVRSGNDLALILEGGNGGVRIAGYFDGTQDWQVALANGTTMSMTDMLANADKGDSSFAASKASYQAEVQLAWQALCNRNGLVAGADGTYSKMSIRSGVVDAMTEESFQFDNVALSGDAGSYSIEQEWHSVATYKTISMTAYSSLGSVGAPGGGGGSYRVVAGDRDSDSVDAASMEENYGNGTYLVQNGAGGPGGSALLKGGALSRTTVNVQTMVTTSVVDHVPVVTGNENDNTIQVMGRGIVDGGGGNDHLSVVGDIDGDYWTVGLDYFVSDYEHWAPWPDQFTGVAEQLPGAFLYGNFGNDVLVGGRSNDLLMGGAGADAMEGGGGGDRYLLQENDSVDVVSDTGQDFMVAYSLWYYQEQGFSTGEINYRSKYGGWWALGNDGSDLAFRSRGEAQAFLDNWERNHERPYGGYDSETPRYVDPLPPLPPADLSNAATQDALVAAGVLHPDRVVMPAGVTAADLTVAGGVVNGYVTIMTPNGSGVTIGLPKAGDPAGTGIERIEFSDGTYLTLGEIAARGIGSAGADNVMLGAQDDAVFTDAGDDVINGGAGNDTLNGGLGDDTYLFNPGDRSDTVLDAGGTDRIVMGAGIDPNQIVVGRDAKGHIVLGVADGDNIRFADHGDGTYAAETIEFADGTIWNAGDLSGRLQAPPHLSLSIPENTTQIAGMGRGWSFDAWQYVTCSTENAPAWYGGQLHFSATLADGSPLPSWINLADPMYPERALEDAANGRFYGTPVKADAGRYDIRITATDAAGCSVDTVVTVIVANNPPTGDMRIEGKAMKGCVIEVTGYLVDAEGLGDFNYQWQSSVDGASWTDISGASARSFTLTDAQVGQQVRVVTSYIDGMDNPESFASSATTAVQDALSLIGTDADDTLVGTAGSDLIDGGAGADTIDGGVGDDVLKGGSGDDTYLFSVGSGVDTISDHDATAGNTDIVQFIDLAAIDLTSLERKGNDLVMKYGANDQVTVTNYFDSAANYRVEQIKFSDGVVWDDAAINARVIISGTSADDGITGYDDVSNRIYGLDGNDYLAGGSQDDFLDGGSGVDWMPGGSGNDILNGGAGDDVIWGEDGNDILDGGTGNDSLQGDAGDDTYVFGRDYGVDTVVDSDDTPANTDTATFLSGIAADQIWFRHVGNNLEASIVGTSDTLTIQNWYSGSAYHLEQFKTADGKILLDSQVESLVQAMASFAPPASGQTILPTDYQTALQPVIAANWQ